MNLYLLCVAPSVFSNPLRLVCPNLEQNPLFIATLQVLTGIRQEKAHEVPILALRPPRSHSGPPLSPVHSHHGTWGAE